VILIGGNGTGKTVMLDAFVRKTAKEHPHEKVIFAIHQYFFQSRPLHGRQA
jgi:chromosomal replication initiation ATPase DnaA